MQRRFLYRSSAVGLSGTFSRPFSEVVEVQAGTALPTAGGYGSARVEDFRYRDLISFCSATSTVSGSEGDDGVHNTLATVTIEGLDVMGVVTADRIVARLVSEHPGEQEALPVLPVGSHFENLRIAGVPVDPQPHRLLFEGATFSELEEASREAPSPFVDPQGSRFRSAGPLAGARRDAAAKGGAPIPSFEERLMLTSLFDVPNGRSAGKAAAAGCAISVAGFGTVFIGEYLISGYARRLTMLRLELGSPVKGAVVVGIVDCNGTLYP